MPSRYDPELFIPENYLKLMYLGHSSQCLGTTLSGGHNVRGHKVQGRNVKAPFQEKKAWLTKGMDDIQDKTYGGGLLAKFLRLAVAVHLIPIERSGGGDGAGGGDGGCDGDDKGRLMYRPRSRVSVGSQLVWRLLPNLIYMSCVAYLWLDDSLWASFWGCIYQTLLLSAIDTISLGLTLGCFVVLDMFLPTLLATLLVDIQDAVSINSLTWPQPSRGRSIDWQPLIATLLIPTFMVLEVLYMLLPWLNNFTTNVTPMFAFALYVWFYGPMLYYVLLALILLVVAELLATQCIAYLNQKVADLKHKAEANECILDAADFLLAEYQRMRSALEPISFLGVCSTTLLLVLDLFYCTSMSLNTLAISLAFLHLLVINMMLLYHFCVSADDCYSNFKSVLCPLR
jgi:hypothetical protein